VGESDQTGHVFLSYVREDSSAVDRLKALLESAGIRVWRDTTELWPGEDWRAKIRNAITSDAIVFIACFSSHSVARPSTHQNEELTLAIEEVRRRPAGAVWLIPVRLDDCEIPDRDIGGGRTLHSLNHTDLFGPGGREGADRLVTAVRQKLGRSPDRLAAQVPRVSSTDWSQVGRDQASPGQASPGQASGGPADRTGRAGQRSADIAGPTFGIITAIPAEFAAMQALIDDPQRRTVAPDRADYVVGTIPSLDPDQSHQVVLTLLGGTGNDAASSGCANLIRSFGSVRCVLMVGTAAGVPKRTEPTRHVRLGDIVVARWGVVEYDSVTDGVHGPVPRRTFPAASPLLERRARMLEVGELAGRRPWEECLAHAADLLAGYGRPPESADVLYVSDESNVQLPHPALALSGHRPGQPKVHCGVIASGDRSLRSARRRDEIADSAPDVLAIEMEGKGVGSTGFSEGVEWLVIRGISDYGDNHVTRDWRNYASLAAAAYTRALLAECPPIIPSPQSLASLDDQFQRLAAAMDRQWRRGAGDQGLNGSMVCAFTSHTRTVLAVEFSPHGSVLATSSEDSTARLWDTRTGTPIRTLAGHAGAVNSVRFSPDGTFLATASEDRTARLWRVADGAHSCIMSGHDAAVWKVAFSPDGALLATASNDHTARLWQVATGNLARTCTGHDGPVLGIAFSPDGGLLATASEDRTARLWRTSTGSAIATLAGHEGRVWQAVFSPDGHLLATVSEDATARLWDTTDGVPAATLAGHVGDVNAAAFSPDGTLLATAGQDKTARLWDTATGAPITTLASHTSAVWLVTFSKDGSLLATADEDHVVRLWEQHTSPANIISTVIN
jgi:nucleoside phosphorylase